MQAARPEFDFTVLANEYGFYCMPDAFARREIAQVLKAGGVYEPATIAFLRRQMGAGDIVTGGAFVGDFLPALCEALAPGAMLHSFEPNPLCLEAARGTIRLNRLERVALHPVAVGERADRLVLQVANQKGEEIAASGKIVRDMAPGDTRGVEVDVATLDSLVPDGRAVSVLHLDVEGFELAALAGAERLLRDHAPLVVLEAARPRKLKQCMKMLTRLVPGAGYRHCGTIENNAIFRAFGTV